MVKMVGRIVLAALLGSQLAATAQVAGDFQQWRLAPQAVQPAGNLASPDRVDLGKMLFYDRRLSGDGKSSCASCHIPERAWGDGKALAIGFGGKPMRRNSMSLVNIGYYPGPFMWAGQKATLEQQVLAPMTHPDIMATDFTGLLAWLNAEPTYRAKFARAYPGEPIDAATLSKAIANFERSIVSRDTAFDRWLAGSTDAMTPQQLRGLVLFTSSNKANCASCHTAPNFSDNGFYNIGLESVDVGRFAVRPVPILKGAFKVPQLRESLHKAPYMHDGSLATLMDVVQHYNKGGRGGGVGTVSGGISPLKLTRREQEDLVAFLRALSGPPPLLPAPRLP
ncbi:MAG: cytochrome c peroxidase [Pseudomonadota bacterium]